MFFYLLLITFTMIYAANIPPAAVFEDNDSFAAPSDFMIGSESNESLQKYITRDKYSKQHEPSMDSYVRAYKKFHEKYQTAEERSMDEINRENQNSIDHKIKKRSAPPKPSSPPREMIKFELSDAKVPDFMTTKLLSTRVPPNIADAVYDTATPATDKDAKSSGSRMIKIVHPIRSSRGISLDAFSAPVSKASFKLYLNDKNNPFSYKGPYSPASQRPKFSTSSRNYSPTDRTVSLGSGQNQLGPHQTPGLKEYSGKSWKRPQSRPSAQYVPTMKKVPQFGYTIPPVSSLSNSLSNTLTVSSLSSLAQPQSQKTYTSLLEGATATDSNRFGEPFRSSLSDPTFSFDEGGLAALTALIGKAPNQQLKALDELLKKDQQTRPQDSTSPILFHPTTESSFRASTTPKSVDFFPESEAGRLAFEDITRYYGGGSLPTPFTPSDDHKPIFETVTERPERPTPPPILISPTAVTLRTPEDVLRIPGEFQASALVDQEDDKASGYAFGYRVRDYHTGNDYGHTQNRDLDGVTRGQYHILLPDGRVQNVRYTADDDGFHAQITYDSVHNHK